MIKVYRLYPVGNEKEPIRELCAEHPSKGSAIAWLSWAMQLTGRKREDFEIEET